MPQVKRNLVSTIKNLFTSFLTSFYVTEDFLRKNNLKKIKKTLLENIRKISKLGGDRVKCSVLPPKEIFLTVKVKDYAKADIKVFWSCPIFIFFIFYQILCAGLQSGVFTLWKDSRSGTLLT